MEVERNGKKIRAELLMADADMVNQDLLYTPPNACFFNEIEQAMPWPNSLRLSFESVFQDELVSAGAKLSASSDESLDGAAGGSSSSSDVTHAPSRLSSSSLAAAMEHGPYMAELGATHDLFPGRERGSERLQELLQIERRWEHRVDELFASYRRGQALGEVGHVKQELHGGLHSIEQLLDTSALRVDDLYAALELKGRFETVLHKCHVLAHEERFHEAPQSVEPQELVSLAWVAQPLPKSFKNKNRARATNKKKKGHCVMEAQLVQAPGASFSPTSAVTAYFYAGSAADETPGQQQQQAQHEAKRKRSRKRTTEDMTEGGEHRSDVQIQNNVEKLNRDRVQFNFRFPAGTRNKPCSIRLHVRGVLALPDGSKSDVEVVSEPTNRFIVTTNECQYESAELKLMALEMFPNGRDSCSWARFVNALNVRWMRVTRQEDDSTPAAVMDRVLSAEDLAYLAARFFSDAPRSVHYAQVAAFYDFFGKVTHHYRHNLAVRQLLLEGLIWGFMDKNESQRRLLALPAGAFVIRVSDAQPGAFSLSWHDGAMGAVRHAHLDSKVLASSSGAIADYLAAKPFLKFLYTPFVVQQGQAVQRATLRHKDDALGHLYVEASKAAPVVARVNDGYDDLNAL